MSAKEKIREWARKHPKDAARVAAAHVAVNAASRRRSVPPVRREFPVGSVVVRGRADIVEEVIAYEGERVRLNALYLGRRCSTEIVIELPMRARAATPADHEQAKRYAARFEEKKDADES